MMLNIYQEILMDHYKNPRNRGILDNSSFVTHQSNSSCGDEITCYGMIEGTLLCDIRFDGKGCVISQATASLLSERVKNSSLADINALRKETIIELIGIPLGPVRLQCALLPAIALQNGINDYLQNKKSE